MNKVKAGILERDGQELFNVEEINELTDFLQSAGIAFKGSLNHKIERVGGVVKTTIPNYSVKPIYSNDDLTAYEVFNGTNQITANRLVRGDFSYTNDNLTQEVWKIYDTADGTTILRTITVNHTYSDDNLINSEVSEA